MEAVAAGGVDVMVSGAAGSWTTPVICVMAVAACMGRLM